LYSESEDMARSLDSADLLFSPPFEVAENEPKLKLLAASFAFGVSTAGAREASVPPSSTWALFPESTVLPDPKEKPDEVADGDGDEAVCATKSNAGGFSSSSSLPPVPMASGETLSLGIAKENSPRVCMAPPRVFAPIERLSLPSASPFPFPLLVPSETLPDACGVWKRGLEMVPSDCAPRRSCEPLAGVGVALRALAPVVRSKRID
jgi:hypothetical protein